MFFYPLALVVAVIDQIIKSIVTNSLPLNHSLPLLGKFLKLTHVRNSGAAFSLFAGFSPYLTIISLLVMAIVVYFHYKAPADDLPLQLGLSLLFGGSLGNFWDRVSRHYVIDYLDISVWPVFNFADIMINLGVIIILLNILKSRRPAAGG